MLLLKGNTCKEQVRGCAGSMYQFSTQVREQVNEGLADPQSSAQSAGRIKSSTGAASACDTIYESWPALKSAEA